jgi:hypothetical protein
VIVSVWRSATKQQLVETENPSACVVVNWKVCKSAIVLYCLEVRVVLTVIKRECTKKGQ